MQPQEEVTQIAYSVDASRISGTVRPVKSKSMIHRYLMCAYLHGEYEAARSRIDAADISADVRATMNCLESMLSGENVLRCGESGTTLRMLMPLAAAEGRTADFVLEGSLVGRPIAELERVLEEHGAVIRHKQPEIISISGRLTAGTFRLPGNVSSQYISGLLLADWYMKCASGSEAQTAQSGMHPIIIEVDGPLHSRPYAEMTSHMLESYNLDMPLESDWSSGALWLAAGRLLGSGRLKIEGLSADALTDVPAPQTAGLSENSLQADSVFGKMMVRFDRCGTAAGTSLDFDISDCPDLAPAIALRALARDGITRITNAGRLRKKECDRIQYISAILTELGADILEGEDNLTVFGHGPGKLAGSNEVINTGGDHRMVMLAALASCITAKPVIIDTFAPVAKSYPLFRSELERLGAIIREID